jgi:hypothetical protein
MSANEKTINGTDKEKSSQKKRQRSPGYPAIPIDDAITRIGQVYQRDRRAYTTYNAVLEHLGYSAKNRSGTSGRIVSALRQYGLLDEENDQLRVSDLAFRILHTANESEERAELIRQAAFKPPIFRKLLSHYKGELPSDAALRNHLVLREGFNPDSIEQFIRVLRRTVEIANPSAQDYSIGEEVDGLERHQGGTPMQPDSQSHVTVTPTPRAAFTPTPTLQNQQSGHLPLPQGESVLVFKISRDTEARVFFTGQVTQEAIDKLSALLNLSKDAYPMKAELEQPRPAIWHNKDHDVPVRVTGAAGPGPDGRQYMHIEDSDRGVPEDELEFEQA